MKTFITAFKYYLFSFLVIVNESFAQSASLNGLFELQLFSTGLTIIFGSVAILKWFSYWNSFDPSNPFIPALSPAALTFFTFNWKEFAKMVNLI